MPPRNSVEALGRSRTPSPLRAFLGRARTDRFALACFVVYVAVAYAAILFHFGKDEWFTRSDWAFILDGVYPSVFEPVEQHWSTVPMLLHRALFHWFGARYLPFLTVVSGLHLAAVCLVRVILRRSGVRAWPANLAAALLVLFGPGYMAIVFALQITQNLSLVFGLSQLILADHDGPLGPRDGLGLLAGLIGLMSSGLSVILVVCVGVCTLARRGVRAAAFHTVPLGVLYVVWFHLTRPATLAGRDVFRAGEYSGHAHAAFVWKGISGTMLSLGHFEVTGLALSTILIVGILLAARSERTEANALLPPLGLLGCIPLYLAIVGYQRSSSGVDYATYSHHLYTVACFVLPALGVGADAIALRWPRLAPVVAGALLLPLPFNTEGFDQSANLNIFLSTSFLQRNRQMLLAIAHSRYAAEALHVNRANLATDRWYSGLLTVGWALDQAKLGRIPEPDAVDPDLDESLELLYGVTFLGTEPPGPECREHREPLEVRPARGDVIRTRSPVSVFIARRDESSAGVTFGSSSAPTEGQSFRVEISGMVFRLAPVEGMSSFTECSPVH